MASHTYDLFARAMVERKQIVCIYSKLRRELCPVMLGLNKNSEEAALTYQFAGETSNPRGLPPQGEWRCLVLSGVSDVSLRDGPWHVGTGHSVPSSCLKVVDLDINPNSPYRPKRRLSDLVF